MTVLGKTEVFWDLCSLTASCWVVCGHSRRPDPQDEIEIWGHCIQAEAHGLMTAPTVLTLPPSFRCDRLPSAATDGQVHVLWTASWLGGALGFKGPIDFSSVNWGVSSELKAALLCSSADDLGPYWTASRSWDLLQFPYPSWASTVLEIRVLGKRWAQSMHEDSTNTRL